MKGRVATMYLTLHHIYVTDVTALESLNLGKTPLSVPSVTASRPPKVLTPVSATPSGMGWGRMTAGEHGGTWGVAWVVGLGFVGPGC